MARKKLNSVCYHCGDPASTDEHVPPKSFFPPGERINLFTVPSCVEHNNNKSTEDEYVKTSFLITAKVMGRADLELLINSCARALVRSQRFASEVLDSPEPAYIKTEAGETIETVSCKIDLKRMYNFFGGLARGLYFHHEKKIWKGVIKIALHFLFSKNPLPEDIVKNEELLALFDKSDSHGKNKNIFYYNFVYVLDDNKSVIGYILCLCFYDEFKVSIVLFPNNMSQSEVSAISIG